MCVGCIASGLPLHVFIRNFIRSVYLGQVIYNIDANISQATKSVFFVLVDDDNDDDDDVILISQQLAQCVYNRGGNSLDRHNF